MIGSFALNTVRPSYSGSPFLDTARIIHVAGLVEPIADAGIEVVRAMRGRCMDSTGALVGSDIFSIHAEDFAIEEGMMECLSIQCRPFEACDFFRPFKSSRGLYRCSQGLGYDVDVAICIFQGDVFELGMECDRQRRRKRPWRGRPDDAV